MANCKTPIDLLYHLYVRCCTLEEFRREFIDESPMQLMDSADANYLTFLNCIIVGIPVNATIILPVASNYVRAGLLHWLSESKVDVHFDNVISSLPHSFFRWNNEHLPQKLIFEKKFYRRLFYEVGKEWFLNLFANYGIFAKVEERSFWQIGGQSAADLFFSSNRPKEKGIEGSIIDKLKVGNLIKWNKLLHNRLYKSKGYRFNLVDDVSKKKWDDDIGTTLINAIWSSKNRETFNEIKFKLILYQFLENYRRFDFEASFRFHCKYQRRKHNLSSVDIKKVIQFVRAIIFKTIPHDLLGSTKNREAFQKLVAYVLKLGINDQPSLEHIFDKIKVEHCHQWLNVTADKILDAHQLFLDFLLWILNDYLLICLSTFFYVTEMDGENKRTFFYIKSCWRHLENVTMQNFVENDTLQRLDNSQAEHCLKYKGYIEKKVRFVPKNVITKELRPIFFEKRDENASGQLKSDLNILNYVLRSSAKYRGCSILHKDSNANIIAVWRNFVIKARAKNVSKLYFVKLDIKSCFTRINHDKLLSVLDDISEEERFRKIWLRTFFVLRSLNGKAAMRYKRNVNSPFVSFTDIYKVNRKAYSNKVLVNTNRIKCEEIRHVIGRVKNEVTKNIINFNKKFYRQARGLSQGGTLSSSLCNIYFGHMENKQLRDFLAGNAEEDEPELCTRYIDDYLFVTPSKSRASLWKTLVGKGMKDYQALENDDKLITNFDCSWSQNVSRYIKYFGLEIDTKTLEMNVDYSKYKGKALSHSFNVVAKKGFAGIKAQMFRNACLNDKFFLFDGKVCARQSIIRKLYEFVYIFASKLYSSLSRLPPKQRSHLQLNPKEIETTLKQCFDYIARQLSAKRKDGIVEYPFKSISVIWIGLKAVIHKFRKHRAQYTKLVKGLESVLDNLEKGKKFRPGDKQYFGEAIKRFPKALEKVRR